MVKLLSLILISLWGFDLLAAAKDGGGGSGASKARADSGIKITHLEATGPGGSLTEDDIKGWFLHEVDFVNPGLRTPKCLEVSKLVNRAGRSAKSLTADQVFFISTRPGCFLEEPNPKEKMPAPSLVFVVKHYKSGAEAEKEMDQLRALKKELGTTKWGPNLPRIVFTESFYKYPNQHKSEENRGDYRFISLIHPAKGQNLWALIEQYVAEQDLTQKAEIRKQLLAAYSKLGEVTANLHLKFMTGAGCPFRSHLQRGVELVEQHRKGGKMAQGSLMSCKTKVHGDLHAKNIFWDGRTISLIDIATMQKPPYGMSWLEEISYSFGTLYAFTSSLFDDDKVSQLKRKTLVEDLTKAFFTSYLRIFKARNRGAYPELLDFLDQWVVGVIRMKNITQDDQLGPFWKGRIMPVLRAAPI